MAYRTYINGVQIFGNNEFYEEWIDFIISQGIDVDSDGCYHGSITDVQGALTVIDTIILRIEKERNEDGKTLFDLSDVKKNWQGEETIPFSQSLMQRFECGYLFMGVNFLLACKDDIDYAYKDGVCCRIKQGKSISIDAY